MIEDAMIQIFLNSTGLSDFKMPETVFDLRFPNDMFHSSPTDVNDLVELLNDHQISHFYRYLIMSYLLDTPEVNGYSVGWFRADINSGWELLPICYAYTKTGAKAYTVKGTSTVPWNMVLFLKNKQTYLDLLEVAIDKCEAFVKEYRTYNHLDIPINKQVDFISKLDSKLKEMQVSLDLVTVA